KRQYPWGDDWDAQACNHSVSRNRLQRTSPVDAYETKGNVSPCGVVDMAGNAWEWCLTHVLTGSQEKEGSDARVHRGGSWFDDDPNRFKVTARHKPFPGFWTLYWAFRICLTF
ncbi:MAG: SUMF1/EgtB/PvdO family nonheme iron enzyme, partial [Chloroflexota bacterium]